MANIYVSNAAELSAALLATTGGDTIYLHPGDYGDLKLKNKSFSSMVTLVSLDENNPADFRTVFLTNVSNMTFQSVQIGYELAPGEALFAIMAKITDSSKITFDNVHFHGSLDSDPNNDGNGLGVGGSDRIKVVNSTFEQLGRGAIFGNSTNIELVNNEFHDLRTDGADFSEVENVVIANNRFWNFFPEPGNHPDAIQFFTGSTRNSSNILIRDNVIMQGDGRGIQGIFMRNADGLLPYEHVKILNNLVYITDGHNGLSVTSGRDVTVEGNTVLSPTTSSYTVWIALKNVAGGVVRGNVTDAILNTNNSQVVIRENVRLDLMPDRANEIDDLNRGPAATPGGLVVEGFGYQPTSTSTSPELPRLGTAADDGFYIGATLDAGDVIDGLGGNDQIAIQGNYNLVLGAYNLSNVEILSVLPGNDARFGDAAGNFYDYDITTVDANVAAGGTLTISANRLRHGESLILDASAETDGTIIVYAGKGDDWLIGGAGNDGFFFGDGAFTGADRIDGGGGNDQVAFRGNYPSLVFSDDTIQNVESLALVSGSNTRFGPLASGYGYDITLADGNTASGARLIVHGVDLLPTESMRIDGSAETNGFLRILAGKGNDTLIGGACADFFYGNLGADRMTGGGGADIFHYRTAAESNGLAYDSLIGFDCREDRIDLLNDLAGFNDLVIGGRLSAATLEADLNSALEGLPGAHEAALFMPNAGDLTGRIFVVVDLDGVAGFSTSNDLLIEFVGPVVPLSPAVDIFI